MLPLRALVPTPKTDAGPPDVPVEPEAVPSAEPEQTAPSDPDAWKRSPVTSGLAWLARHQNEDGSWGDGPATLEGEHLGRTGITALALLSFLGAGYSQYSKDDYGGALPGEAVRRSLKWFLKEQSPDGTFGSGRDLEQALGTFALAEAYGVTAAGYLKDPAKKSLDALVRAQFPDGSWGTPAVSAWASQALASGAADDLDIDPEARAQALAYGSTSTHPGLLTARILLTQDRSGCGNQATALFRAPPPAEDAAGWLHASTALYLADGRTGGLWEQWRGPMAAVARAGQAPDGGWPGATASDGVVRTSLSLHLLEIFYRYANQYGLASK